MALTKVSRGLLTTSIVDNGTATALTIDSAGAATFSGDVTAGGLTVDGSAVINQYLTLKTTDDQVNGWVLYTGTTDKLEFNYNGSGNAEVVIDSTGNVGIGTDSPSAPLNVYNASNPYTKFEDAANYLNVGVITSNYGLINSSLPLSFQVNDTERMRINASGNVGIGQSNPGSRFVVAISNAQGLEISPDSATQVSFLTYNRSTAAYIDLKYRANKHEWYTGASGTGSGMTLDASGNVGVGVTPNAWGAGYNVIDLNTGAAIYGSTTGVSTASNLYFSGSNWIAKTTGAGTLYAQHSGAHFWYNSPSVTAGSTAGLSERMRISSAGNIVHNMDTGSALSQYIEGGSSRGYIGSSNSLISGGLTSFCVRGESGIILSVAGNQSIVIDAGGNFFVGATALTANANFFGTSPGNAFSDFGHISSVASGVAYTRFLYAGSVIGSITQSGTTGVTYTTTSDFRLKKDIKPINNPTQKLLSMNPVTHGWINDPDAKPVVGFIAQEMMNIVPEAVVGDPEGEEMMGMDYGRITPIIVAALQDALKEIKELKTRISEMENK